MTGKKLTDDTVKGLEAKLAIAILALRAVARTPQDPDYIYYGTSEGLSDAIETAKGALAQIEVCTLEGVSS